LHGDIKGASVKKWVMETLLPVRSWLILTPQAVYDENKLETMRSHPVEYLKAEHPKSTSSIRAALLNNKGFYSDEVSLDAAALGLSADVLDYIQKKGIYLKKGSLCNFFADFF
jgi:hypothetical protein